MMITDELVEYLEELGKIHLDNNEKAQTKDDLQKILAYMDTLSELDTGGVEPMSHAFANENVFREDEMRPSANRDLLLSNSERKKDGSYMVPRTFE